jgi:hypothetical protein
MKMLMLLWWFLVSSAAAQNSLIARYHPLPNAKKILVQACAENPNGYTCSHGRVLRWIEAGKVRVQLELFGKTLPIRLKQTPHHILGAWNTDLNQDGKADLIVKLNWGGNGILFDGNITIFALSSLQGHQLSAIAAITFDPNGLIFWHGQPVVLHTSLVSAFSSHTGRRYSFWVYHPLTVRDTRLSAVHAPLWVQYTFGENYRQTNKLSPQEKYTTLKKNILPIFEPLKSW